MEVAANLSGIFRIEIPDLALNRPLLLYRGKLLCINDHASQQSLALQRTVQNAPARLATGHKTSLLAEAARKGSELPR